MRFIIKFSVFFPERSKKKIRVFHVFTVRSTTCQQFNAHRENTISVRNSTL